MKKNKLLLFASVIILFATACTPQSDKQTPEPKDAAGLISLSGDIAGEINISFYDIQQYKSYLEEAARAFMEIYPDTVVNIVPFSVMPETKSEVFENGSMITVVEDIVTMNDYISRTSVELMSGKGADILAADVIPFYKYAENGQLEDLSLYMEADGMFNKSDYRQNILDAMRYKGGLYILPVDFSFEYISFEGSMFNEDELAALSKADSFTLGELIYIGREAFGLATAKSDIPFRMLNAYTGGDIFIELFKHGYKEFINIEEREAYFTDGRFTAMLEMVKSYGEEGYFLPSVSTNPKTYSTRRETIYRTVYFDQEDSDYLYKMKFDFSMPEDFLNGDTIKMIGCRNGEIAFDYGKGYAINSNSQNKATAWEFIKFMASEEMQTALGFFHLNRPIEYNAFEYATRREILADQISYNGEGLEITYSSDEERIEAFYAYLGIVNSYSDMLNTYIFQDSFINHMVSVEVSNYFNGRKSADEVAEALQNRVGLYLNE